MNGLAMNETREMRLKWYAIIGMVVSCAAKVRVTLSLRIRAKAFISCLNSLVSRLRVKLENGSAYRISPRVAKKES